MRLLHLPAALLLSAAVAPAAGPDDAELLAEAQAAFQRGAAVHATEPDQARTAFREAADQYRRLHDRGVRNAELLHNLGKAEFLSDRLPQAVLAFREALALAPDDADIRTTLDYARQQVAYPEGARPAVPADDWPPWLPQPTPRRALAVALAAYVVACLAALAWWLRRGWAWLALLAVALALLVGAATGYALLRGERVEAAARPVVVVAEDDVAFRLGNGPSYPAVEDFPAVHRGTEAALLFSRGDWLQVELITGQTGWLPRSSVLVGDAGPH